MKKNRRTNTFCTVRISKYVVLLIFCFGFLSAFSQTESQTNQVTLDGGMSLLIAAATTFGIKRLFDKPIDKKNY